MVFFVGETRIIGESFSHQQLLTVKLSRPIYFWRTVAEFVEICFCDTRIYFFFEFLIQLQILETNLQQSQTFSEQKNIRRRTLSSPSAPGSSGLRRQRNSSTSNLKSMTQPQSIEGGV